MSVLTLATVSRWYGNVVAVNDVTMTIGPGVTGLLGPNGAGKSTLIHMMAGFLAPSSGSVALDGKEVWRNESIYKHIGLVPEREGMYDVVTGWAFVLPATARIELRPAVEPDTDPVVTFDGQYGVPLAPEDVVTIARAPRVLRLMRTSSRTHFAMLREKLKWGEG